MAKKYEEQWELAVVALWAAVSFLLLVYVVQKHDHDIKEGQQTCTEQLNK
jgi:hypothetical protein